MKKYLVYDAKEQKFTELNGDDYSSTYDMISSNVRGLICCANYFPFEFDAWVNDEGLLINLPYSCIFRFGKETVPLAGNIVFTRTSEWGETIPLEEKDVTNIKTYFETATEYMLDFAHGLMIPVFEREVE